MLALEFFSVLLENTKGLSSNLHAQKANLTIDYSHIQYRVRDRDGRGGEGREGGWYILNK